MSARCTLLLFALAACQDGPTVYLGDGPKRDAGEDQTDGGEDNEPDPEPCGDSSDCTSDERPYCNYESERCVECLSDWQCGAGRYCRNEDWAGACRREN
jgi:Cys-rich repeat protein